MGFEFFEYCRQARIPLAQRFLRRIRYIAKVKDEAIDALLDVWPIFEAFQLTYVSKGLLLEQEKNVSALSPSGPSVGVSATATPAKRGAKTARRD